MFGYLRFILAFLVLISHVDIRFYGLNPGVIAVVIFYMLAGHVVSHLWEDIIPNAPNNQNNKGRLYKFYKDRALRILPLYSYVALLTILFLFITGYADPRFSIIRLISNFLIIPLNYFMWLDNAILTAVHDGWLIPPAWSLGAELQAYIFLPLCLKNKNLKILLTAASFGIYMLANFSVINPDYFGYRLIFGVFFIFVAGSSIQINQTGNSGSGFNFNRYYPWFLWLFIIFLGIFFLRQNLFSPAYTKETFIGIIAGIPLIYFPAKKKINLPWNRLLGSLSYGVFLSHFLLIWCLDYTSFINKNATLYIPAITIGSIIVAYSGIQIIEKRIDAIRRLKALAGSQLSVNN